WSASAPACTWAMTGSGSSSVTTTAARRARRTAWTPARSPTRAGSPAICGCTGRWRASPSGSDRDTSFLAGHVEVGDGALVDLGGHGHRFAQGRVRVDGVGDVGRLGAHFNRQRGLGDQVAGVRADDAGADDAVRSLVEQQLGEALGAADADGAAAGRPRELAHAQLEALLLRLVLGDADPGDLRIGVGH